MIAVLCIFVGLVAAGLVIGLVVAARAPVGYQDEMGFHYGQAEGSLKEEIPYRLPEPKLA